MLMVPCNKFKVWLCNIVTITTAQLHSITFEHMFLADSSHGCSVLEVCNGENHLPWSQQNYASLHFTGLPDFITLQQKYFKEKDHKFCLHHHRQLNQISDKFPLTGTTFLKFQACSTFS